jgi:protein-S-isoprenylcysteine O-methyltransferase Ste14
VSAWLVLLAFLGIAFSFTRPQRAHRLATTGPYRLIRQSQYAAFMVIMPGFLVQWPTLLTLAMFPVLVWMSVQLARAEEREVAREFGEEWQRWAARTPAWIPRRPARARRPA